MRGEEGEEDKGWVKYDEEIKGEREKGGQWRGRKGMRGVAFLLLLVPLRGTKERKIDRMNQYFEG